MLNKLFIILSLVFLVLPSSLAVYDDNFRDCLAQKIYDDCEKNMVWTAESVYYDDGDMVIKTGDVITREKIRDLVDFIDTLDNDYMKIGTPVESYLERFHCDDNYLRVNNNRYYWKGVEVTCPTNVTNINEKCFIKIGEFNFNLFQFSFTLVSISLISIVIIFWLTIKVKKELSFNLLKKKYTFKVEQKPPKKPEP